MSRAHSVIFSKPTAMWGCHNPGASACSGRTCEAEGEGLSGQCPGLGPQNPRLPSRGDLEEEVALVFPPTKPQVWMINMRKFGTNKEPQIGQWVIFKIN